MAAPPAGGGERLTGKDQLIAYFEKGCKPREDWRIGTEHEKFAYHRHDFSPVVYEGERGIKAILEGLQHFGWVPVLENGKIIALKGPTKCDKSSITLEPGGQIELSGAPLENLHQTCREVHQHLDDIKKVVDPLEIGLIGLGFHPMARYQDVEWMPKGRYRIMRDYMPKRGALGVDMMVRTCTIQTNLDFSDEADMVKKFRVSLALQPVATALFANSAFIEGKPNGYQSYRSFTWTDTDPDRCGTLPFVFEDGFGFERYVDYMLDVPMYFVYRDGHYIDVSGQSFRDFMQGRLPGLPGEMPLLSDFEDHMTTVFPEVRLKRYLEMRGADGGPWRRICALPAFWVGLLYDSQSLEACWALIKGWSAEEREVMRRDVPKMGLKAPVPDNEVGAQTVQDLARHLLSLSEAGLARRGYKDQYGEDETHFLKALFDIAETGKSPADVKLKKYYENWGESVAPLFAEYAY